uniref:Uncharacterized protein n=1 Tax=Odontella aurita TaxID=265563 RepID=A0A7S4MM38_9STRA
MPPARGGRRRASPSKRLGREKSGGRTNKKSSASALFLLTATTLFADGASAFCGPPAGVGYPSQDGSMRSAAGRGRPSESKSKSKRLRRRRESESRSSGGGGGGGSTRLFDSLSPAGEDRDDDGGDAAAGGPFGTLQAMMRNVTEGGGPARPTPRQEMSAFFVFVSAGALLLLAMNDEPGRVSLLDQLGRLEDDLTAGYDIRDLGDVLKADGIEILEEEVGELEAVADNIMGVVVPSGAPDLLAGAIGEGIAGAIGAASTWGVQTLVRLRNEAKEATAASIEAVKGQKRRFGRGGGGSGSSNSDDIFTQTVADGDYFLTRAAAIPLLEAVGIPLFTASLASAALATLPYELIKITSRQRAQRAKEDNLLNQLLQEEEARKKSRPFGRNDFGGTIPRAAQPTESESTSGRTNSAPESAPVQINDSERTLDVVEFFADVVKWLEYTVLVQKFSGEFTFMGQQIDPGVESAIFGGLAALSSQLYADNIYIYTDLGRGRAAREARDRDLEGWANLYSTKCIGAATLFGVYASVKLPIGTFIQSLLTGGVDGCLGSDDFDRCAESYVEFNPPAASAEAQFRALADSAVNLADRLLTELLGNADIDVQEWGRGVLVHFYSIVHSILS